ncbi:hypothetical protein GLOTRDRAFT_137305 [Gloeophyllum trabeum ATCC 11539]|uniref:Uncharacterized protein n=1 Tax=Gloeophyllum trabeum (strain ATCC 11539 / FP-39264 / Madison 617) TaxID=670483 RepID=S7RV61_GLOTA|nr:uncharacterized protein GLOTRDRAFT_137305 [Gloeophyllum trabeum ATCC 11539]EPQ58660.1 hypothetical protein GLOTRDRAFT_137305 [Gloeophyllum trabeum ATCC 11539]
MSLVPFIELYRWALQPVAPFAWFGLSISTLDLAAAFRLCIVLRQIREGLRAQHVAKNGAAKLEQRSFVRDAASTLLVVYGGEMLMCPYLGTPPSFIVSGVVPVLYTAIQALVERLPASAIPQPSIHTELPLSLMDGLTRAFLLCTLIPPMVTANPHGALAGSPWTLLLTSLLTANTGFFLVNLGSLLAPTPLALATPPELLPYGWTTTDLWCAPLVTGVYATLTHAQPFWADVHAVAAGLLDQASSLDDGKVAPLDAESARAACAVLLAAMFATRAVKNFGGEWIQQTKPASASPSKAPARRSKKQ